MTESAEQSGSDVVGAGVADTAEKTGEESVEAPVVIEWAKSNRLATVQTPLKGMLVRTVGGERPMVHIRHLRLPEMGRIDSLMPEGGANGLLRLELVVRAALVLAKPLTDLDTGESLKFSVQESSVGLKLANPEVMYAFTPAEISAISAEATSRVNGALSEPQKGN